MSVIKTIIIDDEPGVIGVIRDLINKFCPQIKVVGEAGSVDSGVELIKSNDPDLVLLDIQMPGGSGFDVLERIEYIDFKVIFITAYDQYAIKAIKYNALDYVLNPINSVEFTAAIKKFDRNRLEVDQIKNLLNEFRVKKGIRKIAIPSTGKISYLEIDQILRCEANGSYTNIHLVNGRNILSSKAIKEYEELLPKDLFFRVHRSHLINLSKVIEFSTDINDSVILTDKSVVDVARGKRMEFRAAMSKF